MVEDAGALFHAETRRRGYVVFMEFPEGHAAHLDLESGAKDHEHMNEEQ